MGEIAVKAKTVGKYEEDDIVDAFSEKRIMVNNLQLICFKQNTQRQLSNAVNGIIPLGDIAQTYLEKTSQFKFERIGDKKGKITRLSDGNEIEFDSGVKFTQHNGKEVHMDLETVIAKKKKAAQFPMFGEEGLGVWYGGSTTYEDAALNDIWTDVETKTPERKADNKNIRWPFGNMEMKNNACLITVPFSNSEIANLLEPLYEIDENGDFKWVSYNPDESESVFFGQDAPIDGKSWDRVVVKKRRNQLWDADELYASLGISRADIRNPNKVIDKRNEMVAINDADGFKNKSNGLKRKPFKENRV